MRIVIHSVAALLTAGTVAVAIAAAPIASAAACSNMGGATLCQNMGNVQMYAKPDALPSATSSPYGPFEGFHSGHQ